jgi:hypothetical protein
VLSVIGGMILAGLIVNTVDALRDHLYPLPPGTNPDNAVSMREAVRAMPRPAFLLVLVGWVTGAGLGAYATSQFSGRTAKWPGIAVGLMVLGASAIAMLAQPHPRWLWALAIVFVPAAGYAGTKFALRHPGDADPL